MALAGRTLDRVASLPRYPVILTGQLIDGSVDMKGVTYGSEASGSYTLTVAGAPDIYGVWLQRGASTAGNNPGYEYDSATGILTVHAGATIASGDTIDILILAKGSSVSSGQ